MQFEVVKIQISYDFTLALGGSKCCNGCSNQPVEAINWLGRGLSGEFRFRDRRGSPAVARSESATAGLNRVVRALTPARHAEASVSQEPAMREIVLQTRRRWSALAAAVVALGLVSDVDAGSPRPSTPEPPRLATPRSITSAPQRRIGRTAYPQRRGRMPVPQRPAPVDSSPMIEGLNKALRALGATDRDYDGHREKAITHIGAAIRHLEVPNAKGRSNEAVAKADTGKPPAKTATTPQDASDASLRKARTALFAVHHQLTDKASTVGRIRADAEVRIAIDELSHALKTSTPAAAPAPGTPGK
jgi:hypothetical protein